MYRAFGLDFLAWTTEIVFRALRASRARKGVFWVPKIGKKEEKEKRRRRRRGIFVSLCTDDVTCCLDSLGIGIENVHQK